MSYNTTSRVELGRCVKCSKHATTMRVRCDEHSQDREIDRLRARLVLADKVVEAARQVVPNVKYGAGQWLDTMQAIEVYDAATKEGE